MLIADATTIFSVWEHGGPILYADGARGILVTVASKQFRFWIQDGSGFTEIATATHHLDLETVSWEAVCEAVVEAVIAREEG